MLENTLNFWQSDLKSLETFLNSFVAPTLDTENTPTLSIYKCTKSPCLFVWSYVPKLPYEVCKALNLKLEKIVFIGEPILELVNADEHKLLATLADFLARR